MAIEAYDRFVDAELIRQENKCVCAWHKRFFGTEKVMREAATGHEGDAVSHSICRECREKLYARVMPDRVRQARIVHEGTAVGWYRCDAANCWCHRA
jgi:hypothetical protein